MNLIIYLIAAAIIGWLASSIMRDRSNILINIIVAVIGAFLAGYFISPLLGIGTINDAITVETMLVTLVGAIILIAGIGMAAGLESQLGAFASVYVLFLSFLGPVMAQIVKPLSIVYKRLHI